MIKKVLAKLYLHHFKDAERILINFLNNKDAVYLYLLAKVYQKEEFDDKLLKKLNASKVNYILFLKHLFDDNIVEAKKSLNRVKPRLKVEKDNVLAIKSIVNQEDFNGNQESLKTLYRALLGLDYRAYNVNSFKKIEKEIKRDEEPLLKLKQLLKGESFVKPELIDMSDFDEDKKNRLHFNNMVLMVEKENARKAHTILKTKYKIFATYPESIFPFVNIIREAPAPFSTIKVFYEIYMENFKDVLRYEIINSSSFVFSYILQIYKDRFNDLKELFFKKGFYSYEPYLLLIDGNIPKTDFKFVEEIKDYKFSIIVFVSYLLNEEIEIDKKKRVEITVELFKLILPRYKEIEDTYDRILEQTCKYLLDNFDVISDEDIYRSLYEVLDPILKYKDILQLSFSVKAFLYSYKNKKNIEKIDDSFLGMFDIAGLAKELGIEIDGLPDELMGDIFDFDEKTFDLDIIFNKVKDAKDAEEVLKYLDIIKDKLYFKSYVFINNMFELYIRIYENIGANSKIDGLFLYFIDTIFIERDNRDFLLKKLDDIFHLNKKEAVCSLLRLLINNKCRDFAKAWYLNIVGKYILNCGDPHRRYIERFKKHAKKFKSLKKLYDEVAKSDSSGGLF